MPVDKEIETAEVLVTRKTVRLGEAKMGVCN